MLCSQSKAAFPRGSSSFNQAKSSPSLVITLQPLITRGPGRGGPSSGKHPCCQTKITPVPPAGQLDVVEGVGARMEFRTGQE